jgi:O-antigen/teichoic acid export membrane protein
VVVFLSLVSKSIITVLFGKKYMPSVEIFQILLLGFLFTGTLRIPIGNFISSLGLVKYNLLISIFSGILNLILDYFFILKYGTIGAAYSTVSVMLFSSLLGVFFVLKYFSKHLHAV